MLRIQINRTTLLLLGLACGLLSSTGCLQGELLGSSQQAGIGIPAPGTVPTELSKVSLPEYVIEPPDVLYLRAVVRVRDEDNEEVFTNELNELPLQPVTGDYTVRPDGSVYLGIYGSVNVAGMTMSEAASAIRDRLAKESDSASGGIDPELILLILDVVQYNSKKYYVITDGGGYGEQIYPFPITGSDTVLTALANINGLPAVASKRNIWVARATPHIGQIEQILPVDYVGMTQHGVTLTNYQLFPNDRVYVKANRLVTLDTSIARVLSPIQKLFQITLLGTSTVNQVRGRGFGFNNGIR